MLDFEVFQGKNTFWDQTQGIAVASVLRMVETVPPGSHLFFDRYFTTMKLMDTLQAKSFPTTGTLMMNRVHKECKLPGDKMMKKQGRGATVSMVRKKPKLSITKWYDNKSVIMASTVHGRDPEDICTRWCKKEKKYVQVKRPVVIKQYNDNMGGVDLCDHGVDLCDRMLSFYSMSNRTTKWTTNYGYQACREVQK
ncbi:hypothetical protein ACEWY4_022598 [Coilia grayii]|uniref:PiggyBac transposable element-derived protein domain-containing protein n=1 Tax=Coilia grayii TaxID=363190 RepID=A0ABD1J889_9TELE